MPATLKLLARPRSAEQPTERRRHDALGVSRSLRPKFANSSQFFHEMSADFHFDFILGSYNATHAKFRVGPSALRVLPTITQGKSPNKPI